MGLLSLFVWFFNFNGALRRLRLLLAQGTFCNDVANVCSGTCVGERMPWILETFDNGFAKFTCLVLQF